MTDAHIFSEDRSHCMIILLDCLFFILQQLYFFQLFTISNTEISYGEESKVIIIFECTMY